MQMEQNDTSLQSFKMVTIQGAHINLLVTIQGKRQLYFAYAMLNLDHTDMS